MAIDDSFFEKIRNLGAKELSDEAKAVPKELGPAVNDKAFAILNDRHGCNFIGVDYKDIKAYEVIKAIVAAYRILIEPPYSSARLY